MLGVEEQHSAEGVRPYVMQVLCPVIQFDHLAV